MQVLTQTLRKKGQEYQLVGCQDLVGCFIIVLALARFKSQIIKCETDSVACGFANTLGNKGAVIVRIKLDTNLVFSFVSTHLPAHQAKVSERLTAVE